jgi:hypothetical protein
LYLICDLAAITKGLGPLTNKLTPPGLTLS